MRAPLPSRSLSEAEAAALLALDLPARLATIDPDGFPRITPIWFVRRRYGSAVFTGIVRERGRVVSLDGGRLVVAATTGAAVGDSVSLDGVCLTVVDARDGTLAFDVVPETVARVKPFRREVNVEPALRTGDPLGGHFVQGHVDGVGRVRSVEPEDDGRRAWIEAPPELLRYLVEKGSVAVDGVSLTVAALTDDAFAVALVPHTLAVTTLGSLAAGDEVNLEVDVLAKYVERLLDPRAGRGDA